MTQLNPVVQKIAEQAEDWADKQNFYESDYRDYFNEKFAELIVRECTSVVDNLEGSDYIPWVNAAIKKHFGVES